MRGIMRRTDSFFVGNGPSDHGLHMKIRAKMNATMPPRAPAEQAAPDDQLFHGFGSVVSVAGKAEEMAGVVDELGGMRASLPEHRRRSLVHADEVEDQQSEERGERLQHRGANARNIERPRLTPVDVAR